MKVGNKYFVRVDYKIENNEFDETDFFDDHIAYFKQVSTERFFLGGGFNNTVGGMIILEAKDINEAKKIADGDPLIQKKLYRYELFEWNIVLASSN